MLNIAETLESMKNSMRAGKISLIDKFEYRDKLISHFVRLNENDRRMRFGVVLNNDRIAHYVDDQIKNDDIVFAIFDNDGEIVANLHMAKVRNDASAVEFGLSVNEDFRNRGFASALFAKATQFAKTVGCKRIYTYCLGENKAMQHLAKKHQLKVMLEYGDVTGELVLKDRSNVEIVNDLIDFAYTENMMIFDKMSERFVNSIVKQCELLDATAQIFSGSFKKS